MSEYDLILFYISSADIHKMEQLKNTKRKTIFTVYYELRARKLDELLMNIEMLEKIKKDTRING